MTYTVFTLGCKVNFCESAAIERGLTEAGFVPAGEGETPDIFVVNSCTVTSMSEKKARHALSRAKRENPDGVTVLCGCFPQSYPDAAGKIGSADIITGNSRKGKIAELVCEYLKSRGRIMRVEPLSRRFDAESAAPDLDRTRAFIKIEDGCDRFCTYCAIPLARGRVRSLPPEEISAQSAECARLGHKEIVLTGINLGCYGREMGLDIADAVKAADTDGIERIRLGSLEPEMITDDVITKLLQVRKLCPHFHLSLQSGSDTVLTRMNRKYDTAYYSELVEKLRGAFDNCAVTTDIMVGFPGETEDEFKESMEFARAAGFAGIHVFPYSMRPGTVAAARFDQIAPRIRTDRAREFSLLAKELERAFFNSQLGTEHTVLVEKPVSEDYSSGYTENYIPVRIYWEKLPRFSAVRVVITDVRDGYCLARVVK